MFRIIALSLLVSTSLFSFSSFAQDAAPAEEPATQEEAVSEDVAKADAEAEARMKEQAVIETEEEKVNPGLKKLNDLLRDMTIDMDKNNRRHFYMIYNNHNLIATVKYVRTKVSEAIDACSAENPDMEGALRDRFKVWTDAVDASMGEAEAYRDNMIEAQDYAKKSDIRDIMKQADKLRAETSEEVKTIPVTSKEACEYLLNKMDETQERMLAILRTTLITLPQALQNMPAEDAPEAKVEPATEEPAAEEPSAE